MSISKLHLASPLEAVRTRRVPLPPARLLAVLAVLALAAALFGVLPVHGQTDTTAPSFLPTDANTFVDTGGDIVILKFDEALDIGNLPPASAFTVTADGSDVPVTAVATASANTTFLGLTLGIHIGNAQVVKVSYADPTAGNDVKAIQDAAGNDAASFSDVTIFNNSGLPPLPQDLTATQGTDLVTLNWTVAQGATSIGNYRYRVSTDMGADWGAWTSIPNSSSFTSYDVTGLTLTPGTHFTFQLRSSNLTGNGPAAQAELLALGPDPVIISKESLTIDEGGSGSYTIVLETQPTADVTINIALTNAHTDLTIEPDSVTFTTTDWETPKTVTVEAGQDDDAENDSATIRHSVDSDSAAEYAALTGLDDVAVTVEDDETPGVTISKSELEIDEGGSGTYTIVLDTPLATNPTRSVSIKITAPSPLTVNPALMGFGPSDWNTPQTVTVSAPQDNDAMDESAAITHSVVGGTAPEYQDLPIDSVSVKVDDDEIPPPVITTDDGSLTQRAPFRIKVTFHEDDTGSVQERDLEGWYTGTSYSFTLTDIREEEEDQVFSARVDKILDGKLRVFYKEDVFLSITVDAPHYGSEPGGSNIWSTTMTVEDSAAADKQNNPPTVSGFLGYAKDSTIDDQGSIDDDTFTFRGTTYRVKELIHTPNWATVDLRLDKPLPNNGRGMSLHLGDGRWLRFGDRAHVTMTSANGWYRWEPVLLVDGDGESLWEDGETQTVRIRSGGGV